MTNRKRKGISPIIATVLLIAITIAAGLAIYGWVSGLISAGTSSKVIGSTPLSVTFVSATNAATSSQKTGVTLEIANQGSHDVTLTSSEIEIVASNGDVFVPSTGLTVYLSSTGYGTSGISVTIPAGGTQTVYVTLSKPFTDGNTYTLSIVGATDSEGGTVVANSVTFTVQ